MEKLEEALKIDIKGIFDGINKETNEMINMQNMDIVFKIGLPVFFLGSTCVIDHIEIEEDISAITTDTKQPVELVFQLVRNFKSIPHAIASYKIKRTDFELNVFGYITARMI